MQYYVGLDVSLKQTSICVVNQTGSVVRGHFRQSRAVSRRGRTAVDLQTPTCVRSSRATSTTSTGASDGA
jgi:transposase